MDEIYHSHGCWSTEGSPDHGADEMSIGRHPVTVTVLHWPWHSTSGPVRTVRLGASERIQGRLYRGRTHMYLGKGSMEGLNFSSSMHLNLQLPHALSILILPSSCALYLPTPSWCIIPYWCSIISPSHFYQYPWMPARAITWTLGRR